MRVKLGNIAKIYTGTGFPLQYQGNTSGKYPFYKVGDISRNAQNGNIYLEDCNNYVDDDTVMAICGTIVPEHSIVFAKIGEAVKLNRRAITRCQCLVDNNAIAVCPDCNQVSLMYFFYYLCAVKMEKLAEATTVPSVKKSRIEQLEINLPSIEEQKKIEKKLSKVFSLIALCKQQLATLDELVKARFVEMFGDPVHNSRGLPTKKLNELGSIDRGRSKHRPRNAPELLNGPYPLIQTGEVASAGLYITEYHNTYSEIGLQQSKMWKAGTLCITIAANIAQTAILTFDACFPDSVVGFIPYGDVDAIYMHYWFGFFQKIIEEQAPQVAQKNINLKILSELNVMVPSCEMQEDFANFVQATNKSKRVIQRSMDELETLKKSLMQEYFD